MISRQWRGVARTERAADYEEHLRRDTFPGLAGIEGFLDAAILRRTLRDGVEFLVVTRWKSLDAIARFSGADVEAAVVPPEVQAMMIDYDRRVRHYEVVEDHRDGGMEMSIENAIASVPVKKLADAARWYEQLLQKPADSRPMPEVAEWKFPRGGWLQVYQGPERAGHGSFTLAVSDIEETRAHLERLGIDASHGSSDAKVKTIMIADPDGNSIAFAQALDATMAR